MGEGSAETLPAPGRHPLRSNTPHAWNGSTWTQILAPRPDDPAAAEGAAAGQGEQGGVRRFDGRLGELSAGDPVLLRAVAAEERDPLVVDGHRVGASGMGDEGGLLHGWALLGRAVADPGAAASGTRVVRDLRRAGRGA
ncbi:hypothetical protein [Streptomyces sp. NPDC058326]|uniref:hypothetical protein n=1 Tax=Streptomyces sp. NPDC058326 TaxID=3346447 RepID=UPI0036F111FC